MPEPFDLCWLDCPEEGTLLVWHGRSIVLCPAHHRKLQDGCYGGSYTGAPLPADSLAGAWPWQPGDWSEIPDAA